MTTSLNIIKLTLWFIALLLKWKCIECLYMPVHLINNGHEFGLLTLTGIMYVVGKCHYYCHCADDKTELLKL